MNRYDRQELLRTVSGFMFLLVMASLMGWCAIEPPPKKPLYLEYDNKLVKEDLKRNQAEAMARATATYNAWLEKRGNK